MAEFTSMIERIARVLCAKDASDPDEIGQSEGKATGQSWTGWQAYASDAEDILAAMRGPTPKTFAADDYDHRAVCYGSQ